LPPAPGNLDRGGQVHCNGHSRLPGLQSAGWSGAGVHLDPGIFPDVRAWRQASRSPVSPSRGP